MVLDLQVNLYTVQKQNVTLLPTAQNVIANDNIYFDAPQMVASDINQTNEMSGSKSLFVTCNLTTSNTKLSPVIDTQRISMITVQNRLNSPTSINHPNFKNDES